MRVKLFSQWHHTPVLLPGKSHGRRSLVGCSPWGHEESDTTEQLNNNETQRCQNPIRNTLAGFASLGEGNGTPLQYSCLENPMDGGAWWAAVHGVAKSWIWPSDSTFTFHFHALEKAMATHSSVLAWRISWKEEPGGLQSMGLLRVGHNWSDLAAAAYTLKGIHASFFL